jgi:hypothetical protein
MQDAPLWHDAQGSADYIGFRVGKLGHCNYSERSDRTPFPNSGSIGEAGNYVEGKDLIVHF